MDGVPCCYTHFPHTSSTCALESRVSLVHNICCSTTRGLVRLLSPTTKHTSAQRRINESEQKPNYIHQLFDQRDYSESLTSNPVVIPGSFQSEIQSHPKVINIPHRMNKISDKMELTRSIKASQGRVKPEGQQTTKEP